MGLKIEDLSKVESEFPELYYELFGGVMHRFKLAMKIKN